MHSTNYEFNSPSSVMLPCSKVPSMFRHAGGSAVAKAMVVAATDMALAMVKGISKGRAGTLFHTLLPQ
jgi:hypothetical protein